MSTHNMRCGFLYHFHPARANNIKVLFSSQETLVAEIMVHEGIFRDAFDLKNASRGLHFRIVVRNREISWLDANAAQPRLWRVLARFGRGLGSGSGLGLESGVGLGLRPYLDPNMRTKHV